MSQAYREFIGDLRRERRCGLGVGVHDALTACLGERAGFDVLWLSSLELSTAKLLPDVNLVTYTEVAGALREIAATARVPILVDGDNGYGCDETAVRAALEFAAAGASGICIEDNAFPKRNSFHEGVDRALEPIDAFAGRVAAVRDAAGDRLAVVARTEALIADLGPDEAIERVHRYVEAGADAVFVQTKRTTTEAYLRVLDAVAAETPVMATPTALPGMTAAQLHGHGVDLVVFSNVIVRALVRGLGTVLEELRRHERIEPLGELIAPLDRVFEITGSSDWMSRRRAVNADGAASLR